MDDLHNVISGDDGGYVRNVSNGDVKDNEKLCKN